MNDKYDTYLLMLRERIERDGYAAQYVFGDPATGAAPYGYTVGLHESDGYELAVCGLDASTTAVVLRRLSEQLRREAVKPVADLRVPGITAGYDLQLRPVQDPDALGIVGALYGFDPPAWQAVWPDVKGHFPGDEDHGYGVSGAGQQLL